MSEHEPSIIPQLHRQNMIAFFRSELHQSIDSARASRVTWVKDSDGAVVAAIVPVAVAERGMPADASSYQDPGELVVRVQSRLSEPEEVALALEGIAARIREGGDIRAATGFDLAGGFRDSQGTTMGTTEVR